MSTPRDFQLLESVLLLEPDPCGRQVHVEEKLHGRGSSTSSVIDDLHRDAPRLGLDDLLLDVEGRRVDDEAAPVLLVLATPDELGVQITVAPLVGDAHRILRPFLHDRLVLRGRDVLARGFLAAVAQGLDGLAGRGLCLTVLELTMLAFLAGHGVLPEMTRWPARQGDRWRGRG
jgi:hypothetical protein